VSSRGSTAAVDRYGHDPQLTRATWRALAGVVVAAVLTAAALVAAGLFFLAKGLFLGLRAVQGVAAALHLPVVVVIAVVVLVVRSWCCGVPGSRRGLRPGPRLAPEHPASEALARLAALADVDAPPLVSVALGGANAVVLRDDDDVAVIGLSPGALALPRPELDAVLAHELFHVAHGDIGLVERLEHLAAVAEERTIGAVSRRVRAAVNWLLCQRELSADRAAALLTGRPADVVAALRRCGDDDSLPGTADLRDTTSVAFVPMAMPVRPTPHGGFGSDPPPTHPSVAARTEALARVAAQLSADPRVG
jgi:heat shock protein HtpX